MAAPRIASPYWLLAEGAVLPWQTMLRRRLEQERHGERLGELEERFAEWQKQVSRRPLEIHLRWSCSERLGVPFEPFTVWVRPQQDRPEEVHTRISMVGGGLSLRWGFVAAVIEVECDVVDGSRAVGLFAMRGGGSLRETVGAAAERAPAGTRVTLRVRTSGATRAILVNGSDPSVRCQPLQDVLDDEQWEPFERVGLPADDPWAATAYRASDQGFISAPTDAVSAAHERLQRGGPPIGWWPLTETGVLAPDWRAPDHSRLLDEVRKELLPRIEALFSAGLLPPDQAAILESPPVASPHRGLRTSTLAARAELSPLSLLTLPAASDPFLALATGFGTAYPYEGDLAGEVPIGGLDFLVTGEYEETPRRNGPASIAAFVPAPPAHGATATPTRLKAKRAGLVAPDDADGPWQESVRVSWDRMPSSASLGRPSGAIVARFDPAGAPEAESLVEQRAAGDFRPLVPVPDGPQGTPGFARTAMVDAAAVIPLGSGGRSCGYAVAVEDVFGVWSRWEDVLYSGTEPGPPLPRLLALALSSSYAGSASCPATLEVEVSVDWADRTPTGLDVAGVFFPMATANSVPPAGVDPELPAPAGCFRRDMALTFDAAEALTPPSGVDVEHLDTAGEAIVPPGPMQGGQGRRYRLRMPVPMLDFGTTRRWGVQVWARSSLLVLGAPTDWSPDPAHPARASAASPVPVAPLPPPLPPGVPLGSAPDAAGRSHARVHWSLPAGADVDKVVVWEVAESALRQAAGLPPRAPEGRLPGWRLQDLWNAYDGLTPTRRRSAFRRLQVLPGTARDMDVALPKGSTDIHLFTVTTVTSSAVDSPWPGGSPPHEQLQAVMAPRLVRPSTPRLRSLVAADGTVTLQLSSTSRVPVQSFRLFRTRSPVAARSAETMGPAFAILAVAPPSGTPPDAATGELTYSASWVGAFDASWDEWFIRAVAAPVDVVPPEAVRGVLSLSCEPVSLTVLPQTPPDLAPLVGEIWGAANDGVVVRTSTSAPVRAVALGSHRVSGMAGGTAIPVVALEEVDEDTSTPPASASVAPALVRSPRAGGRTPLAVWFTRPVASEPADVVLRLVDPLGRVIERATTVPGFVPSPRPTLEPIDAFTIAGRGGVLTLRSDAPVDADPAYVLEIVATPSRRPSPRWPFPRPPLLWPPSLRPAPVSASFPLDEVAVRATPFSRFATIQALRTNTTSPFEYSVLVRLQPPFHVRVTLIAPDGTRAEVTAQIR